MLSSTFFRVPALVKLTSGFPDPTRAVAEAMNLGDKDLSQRESISTTSVK